MPFFFKQPDFSSFLHLDNWFLFFQPLFYSMVAPCDIILTSSNYFSWKSRMEDVLRSRRFFRITSGKEIEPIDDDKKIKWENRCDEACGLIGMSISIDLSSQSTSSA